MAQYGRLRFTVLDPNGAPVSGASVEVRHQGATIVSGGPTSFTVNDSGVIVAGDSVRIGTTTAPTRSVSSSTATNVTVGGAGFTGTADDDRITISATLPTLYKDARGAETVSNPMTTDSSGNVEAWAEIRPYDVLISGSGITSRLLQDELPDGHEYLISNTFAGNGPCYIFDTARALSTDDKIISVRENGSEKFSVDDDGDVAGAKGTFSGSVSGTTGTFSGAVSGTTGTFSGAVSGTTGTFSAAVQGTSITATTGDVIATAGALRAVASELRTRRISTSFGTVMTSSDIVLSAGWGTTASMTFPLVQPYDARGSVRIASSGTGQGANPTVTVTYKESHGSADGAPCVIVTRGVGAGVGFGGDQPTIRFTLEDTLAGSFRARFQGTPVAGESYDMFWMVMG